MLEPLKLTPEFPSLSLNTIIQSQTTWLIASLVVVTGTVYWPVHSFEFVNAETDTMTLRA